MRVNVEIDQASFQQLQRKLTPEEYDAVIRDIMSRAAGQGEPYMREAIRGGTEYAMQSIGSRAWPLEARVYSAMAAARGASIEEGRRPGDDPGIMPIARWVSGRRHLTGRRLRELDRGLQEQTLQARAAIIQSGARAKRFIRRTHEHLRQQLPAMLSDAARQIEERFRR